MMQKITRIESFEIVVPLPRPLKLGDMEIPHREYAVVFVYDGDGNVGSSYCLTRNAPVSTTIKKTVAPFWLDKDTATHRAVYDRCVSANVCLGTDGIFWRALSLVDCAVWDLRARSAGVPLSDLITKRRSSFDTILVGGYPLPDETEEDLSRQIRELVSYRPSGIKIAGFGDLNRDTKRLALCRAGMPEGMPLMIDLYWRFTSPSDFDSVGEEWATLGMGWVEDPFPFNDFDSYRGLAERGYFPVAVGDEQSGVLNFQHHLERSKPAVLRLDALVCGGITAFIDIAAEAEARNIPVYCHVYHHVHTQLARALTAVQGVEYMLSSYGLESANLCWAEDLPWEDGSLKPSDNPGTGLIWDMSQLSRYRVN